MGEMSQVMTESIRRLSRVDRQVKMAHSALKECSDHLNIVLNKINIENSLLKMRLMVPKDEEEDSVTSSSSSN